MELTKALTLSLGNLNEPVITSYRLGVTVFFLYKEKAYKGEPLSKLQKELADGRDLNRCIGKLIDEGVLDPYKGLSSNVYSLLGRIHNNPEDVACTIDPFCYMSHLSAMDYHGLTNRIPSKLFLSTPSPKNWKTFALQKMESDLKSDYGNYIESGLPPLRKPKLQKIANKEVHFHNSSHLGAYKNVRNRPLRVSSIGRTFLDMLKNPDLCGGMSHVMEVFEEFSRKYLRLITDEIDSNGNAIDKVRAGYILDERLKIKNDVIESWVKYAQRGGSRKLDSSEEYIPEWSDKWCISINIFKQIKA